MAIDIDASIQILNLKQPDVTPVSHSARPAPTLKIQGGFQWSGDIPQEDANVPGSSEDGDSDGQRPSKKKRKEKKQVELDLSADMQTKTPDSTSNFECMLLGSPNSSYLWIQYMSFQLQVAWVALLNLENVYGSDESLETAFKNAHMALRV